MLDRKKKDSPEFIKEEVEQWRAQNKKRVEIILFPGEEEYLTENLDCIVIPLLFEIKDKHLENLNNCPNFIKRKYNKRFKRVMKLKKKEQKLLDSLGIEYEALGYIVYL